MLLQNKNKNYHIPYFGVKPFFHLWNYGPKYLNQSCEISFKMGFSFLKQTQKSRSVFQDRSRFLGLFWERKTCLITKYIW